MQIEEGEDRDLLLAALAVGARRRLMKLKKYEELHIYNII